MIRKDNIHLLKTHSLTCECCQTPKVRELWAEIEQLQTEEKVYRETLLSLQNESNCIDSPVLEAEDTLLDEKKFLVLDRDEKRLIALEKYIKYVLTKQIERLEEQSNGILNDAEWRASITDDSLYSLIRTHSFQQTFIKTLKQKAPFDELFPIWIDKEFGSIQNIPLQLPNVITKNTNGYKEDWDSFNAALGYVVLFLYVFSHKWKLNTKLHYKPYPMGNFSSIQNSKNGKLYPIYFDTHKNVATDHLAIGLKSLLACVKEIQDNLSLTSKMKLHRIHPESTTIVSSSSSKKFSMSFDSKILSVSQLSTKRRKSWTMGARYLLANLKWFIVFDERSKASSCKK